MTHSFISQHAQNSRESCSSRIEYLHILRVRISVSRGKSGIDSVDVVFCQIVQGLQTF